MSYINLSYFQGYSDCLKNIKSNTSTEDATHWELRLFTALKEEYGDRLIFSKRGYYIKED